MISEFKFHSRHQNLISYNRCLVMLNYCIIIKKNDSDKYSRKTLSNFHTALQNEIVGFSPPFNKARDLCQIIHKSLQMCCLPHDNLILSSERNMNFSAWSRNPSSVRKPYVWSFSQILRDELSRKFFSILLYLPNLIFSIYV